MYKLLLATLAPGAALAVPQAQGWAQAQRYPAKTIEVVVSYGAGGSTDLIARAIAQKLQDRLGQSVVVINKPGASGTIGATAISSAGWCATSAS
jgi:tripartite-type tricarboxylate transporter receptor subunit TctC